MLEDFRLKVFVTVAGEKSFTKAAAVLGVTQPAVSQNVAELEKEVGQKLFQRLRGETVLTEEGKVFKRYADRMLQMAHAAGNVFSKQTPATVRISASEEIYRYVIFPALEEFSRIHPEVLFERVMFDDADLRLSLVPSSGRSFEYEPDAVAKIRVSMSLPSTEMGSLSAAHEHTSYFNLLFQPSASFACTRLCRLLKEFIIVGCSAR